MTETLPLAYIGLGSNLGKPLDYLCFALSVILRHAKIQHIRLASLYISPPFISKVTPEGQVTYAPSQQEDYFNSVVSFETALSPKELLLFLQSIEHQAGRVRQVGQWGGARTLDLDILCYQQACINDKGLTLPHPGIASRACVYRPLLELEPDFCLPGQREALSQYCHDPQESHLRLAQPNEQEKWQACLNAKTIVPSFALSEDKVSGVVE